MELSFHVWYLYFPSLSGISTIQIHRLRTRVLWAKCGGWVRWHISATFVQMRRTAENLRFKGSLPRGNDHFHLTKAFTLMCASNYRDSKILLSHPKERMNALYIQAVESSILWGRAGAVWVHLDLRSWFTLITAFETFTSSTQGKHHGHPPSTKWWDPI